MESILKKVAGIALVAVLALGIIGCTLNENTHDHTFATTYSSDATYHWYAATCGHTTEVKDKTEHTFGEWTITLQPTGTAEGSKERECSVCHYKATETIARLDHVHAKGTHHEAVAGTCKTKGTIEYYDCTKSNCEVKLDADGNSLASIEGELDPANHEETATTFTAIDADNHKETYKCCNAVKTESAPHTWNDGEVTTNPTTEAEGVKTYTCTAEGCGQTKTESIAKLPAFNAYEQPIDAQTGNAATSSSTYIYFGVFPKTVLPLTSSVTVDETVSITMGANTYYKGSDGEYYAKVIENCSGSSGYTYTDTTTVKQSSENSYRYFKVEPIKWKVLTTNYNDTGKALLLAEDILTANVPYYVSQSNRTIDSKTVYANNYKYSTIRAYLNGKYESDDTQDKTAYNGKGFLQTAFTATAQSKIAETEVDNRKETTGYSESTYAADYACESTTDKIFLLSESEVINGDYDFAAYNNSDNARIRVTTDFAKANRAFQITNGGSWWLRSPAKDRNTLARIVLNSGIAKNTGFVDKTEYGVVPALSISF